MRPTEKLQGCQVKTQKQPRVKTVSRISDKGRICLICKEFPQNIREKQEEIFNKTIGKNPTKID